MPGGMMPGGMMPGGMMPDGGGMPGGGMGMMASAGPKDPLVELVRRQIKYEVESVRRGLTGVGRLVDTKDRKVKSLPEEILKEVGEVSKATDPPANYPTMISLDSMKKSLKEKLKPLEKRTAALLPKRKVETPTEPASDVPLDVPSAAPAAAAAAVGVNPVNPIGAAPVGAPPVGAPPVGAAVGAVAAPPGKAAPSGSK